jgi:uncharacterized membrane protein
MNDIKTQEELEELEELLEDVQEDLEVVVKDLSEQEESISLSDHLSDILSNFVGSWQFIGIFCLIMLGWVIINVISLIIFDPYPFILLNLALSTVAAIQAPLIMMSQRRQDQKDRIRNTKIYELIILTHNMMEQQNDHVEELLKKIQNNSNRH